jgi:hypothetical protein
MFYSGDSLPVATGKNNVCLAGVSRPNSSNKFYLATAGNHPPGMKFRNTKLRRGRFAEVF